PAVRPSGPESHAFDQPGAPAPAPPPYQPAAPAMASARRPGRLPAALMLAGTLLLLGGGGLYAYHAVKAGQSTPQPRPALPLAEAIAGVELAGMLPARLVDSGFGQIGRRVAVYFTVENPTATALRDVPYLLTLNGSSPLTSTGTLDLALSGERQTVVRTLFVPEDSEVSDVTVELGGGTAMSLYKDLVYPTVNNTRFRSAAASGADYDQTQAIIDNTMDEPLTNLNMTALLYNEAGEVIGAGSRRWTDALEQGVTRLGLETTLWRDEPVGGIAFGMGWTPASFDYGQISYEPGEGERGYGAKQPDNGVFHAAVGSTVEYPSLPPTSGRHWPQIAGYGDYGDQPVPDEILVHNLEHGAVIISYDPARITSTDEEMLISLYYELYDVNDHVILVQRDDIDQPIAMTSWNYRLLLDEADPAAIRGFYHAHIARGPECFNRRCP
ncbi:MAG TPA: DUF3105 domain-containing protein, partial [Herpetosiphonaceae bacterium]|nr:DUF3105 domain-containing protein [Herpetosiphonaceae bacterium]